MKSRIPLFLFCFLMSGFWASSAALAACASPAGNAADLMYNKDYHVPQYCDGTLWQQMGNQGAGGAGCPGSVYATPTPLQHTLAGSTSAVAFLSTTTVGSLLVACAGWNAHVTTLSASDTAGNSWTVAVGPTYYASVGTNGCLYAKNSTATAGDNVTLSGTGASNAQAIEIAEFSGIVSSSPVDVTNAASGSATPSSGSTNATTNAHDLIFGSALGTGFPSAGAGFTGLDQPSGVTDTGADEYETVSATGSYAATFGGGSQSFVAQMVAFKAASSTDPEGTLMYNASSHVYQFCDGALWRQIGATGAGQVITTNVSSSSTNSGSLSTVKVTNENAIDLLGQFTTVDTVVNYGGNLTNAGGSVSAYGFSTEEGVAIDPNNHHLFVADKVNNRVLVFNLNTDNTIPAAAGGHTADFELGQPSGTAFTSNSPALTQSGMNNPQGLAYDSTNNRLFVVDDGNDRVLIFTGANSITNGENATYLLGESSFTTDVPSTGQAGMSAPSSVAYDSTNGRLFVSDFNNSRVLVFNSGSLTSTTGHNADNELGQPSGTAWTTHAPATTQSGMSNPQQMAFDNTNNRLFVSDNGNYRVLVYNTSSITNGQNAANLLGQSSWTTKTANSTMTAANMSGNAGLAYDGINNRLFVGDTSININRIMVFTNASSLSNNENATDVIGAPSLTSGGICDPAQACPGAPFWFGYDSTNGHLYVSDDDERVMVFPTESVNGLIAWYQFDDGAGTNAIDSSGNGNTATSTVSYTGNPTWISGQINGAELDVGANTQFFEAPDVGSVQLTGGSYTLAAWVKFTTLPTSGHCSALISKHGSPTGTDDISYELIFDNGFRDSTTPPHWILLHQDTGLGLNWSEYHVTPALGTWYHVVGAYDSSTSYMYLYLNGVLVNTDTGPNNPPAVGFNNGLQMGYSDDGACALDGALDDVRIYNRLLSGAEIAALYASGNGVPAGIVGWWKLDDASSGTSPTTAADSSGNGHTGANQNTPTWTGSGMIGNALTLNGTTQEVNVPDAASLQLAGDWTVSEWVNLGALPAAAGLDSLLERDNGSPFYINYGLWLMGSTNTFGTTCTGGRLTVMYQDSSAGYHCVSDTTNAITGTWYLVTGTYVSSSKTLTLYVNGSAVNSAVQSLAPAMSASGAAYIGGATANYVHGTVDDVRIYNRALSDAEVAALYGGSYCGSAAEGALQYNSTYNVMQYCNGTNFVRIGSHAP